MHPANYIKLEPNSPVTIALRYPAPTVAERSANT